MADLRCAALRKVVHSVMRSPRWILAASLTLLIVAPLATPAPAHADPAFLRWVGGPNHA